MLNRMLAILTLAFVVAFPAKAEDLVVESFNGILGPGYALPRPPCCIWSNDTIGWYWTPKQTQLLDSIATKIADVDFGYDNNFTMTVTLFTDRPFVGGTEIASFEFDASKFMPGNEPWRGGTFATPVPVVAGTQYFVGFSGWSQVYVPDVKGGGINWVIDGSTRLPPAGAEFLSQGFTSAGAGAAALYETAMGDATTVTAAPVIQFSGHLAAPVPEPETYVTLLSGLALLGWFMRTRA